VKRTPILLIETLDAAGAAREDAALRVTALRRAGIDARALVVGGDAIPTSESRAVVRAVLAGGQPSRVIVASAAAGGGAIARLLPRGSSAGWWPTGLASPGPLARVARVARGGLRPLGADSPLAWALADRVALQRRRLPLWDGAYVLAPGPLSAGDGAEPLTCFARTAQVRHDIDLVVLADPQPTFVRRARALGVATRVHFVGPAPREAEWAWLSAARAVLFAGAGPVSAGLPVRALLSGSPPVGLGTNGVGRMVRSWASRLIGLPEDPVAALAAALERPERLTGALASAPSLDLHDPGAISWRLAVALGLEQSAERERAAA